ncbi:hypothetical protein GCM10010215_77660 [Streptomyces virginiae]|uniref:Restriction endonuclease n=1 Tax=Streptomyces virginiae TaxID=1961 RepID=A0ABQ3NUP7_STRVG|nr:DUF5677 domain-containing protein [Streptomyces virginiae]MBP2345134.1 hypothetical protein [Streptomyces virginiae]GGQ42770.1 hypothetical protein GCM10010215_77660 [Streptomyces virginiae]GHI16503.1 hypothetical protein Scinn_59660 [Streptomyces virginiae]
MGLSRLQQLVLDQVRESLGENAGIKRTIEEFEPIFGAADDYVVNRIHLLDSETGRSTRWSLKYGRKRRARSAAHNERSILKKLGFGFRQFSDAITLAEDANRDLFTAFRRWLRTGGDSRSLVDPENGVGGAALHVLIMLGIHARGCSIASEIDLLARRGHTEGAHARARSLYELMILAGFLAVHDTVDFELTERYHLSAMVEKRRDARHTGEEDPFDRADELEERIRSLWGPSFFRPYGWAAPGIQAHSGSRITFRDVEEASGLDAMRHCYLTMNHAIHGGAMAVTTRFDRRNPFPNATGSEVNYYSVAWIAGASATFFHFLNRLTLEGVAELVDPNELFFLAPLSHCDAAEEFFRSYAASHEPDND